MEWLKVLDRIFSITGSGLDNTGAGPAEACESMFARVDDYILGSDW